MSVPSQSKRTPSMVCFRFAGMLRQGSRKIAGVEFGESRGERGQIEKLVREKVADENYGFRKREGMWSSRSNWTSSKAAATPYQPGMAAGSVRHICAIVAMTTLPSPRGLLTRTISSSTEVPMGNCLGQRK